MKIKEAVKLTGKSRTAILRALNEGKISGEKDSRGVWDVQPVDLLKYYEIEPSKLDEQVSGEHVRTPVSGAPRTPQNAQVRTPPDTPDTTQIKVLQAQLDAVQQIVEDRGKTIEHLRGELDEEKQERRAAQTKLTALLTDQREKAPEKPVERPLVRVGYVWALVVALAAVAVFLGYLWLSGAGGLAGLSPRSLSALVTIPTQHIPTADLTSSEALHVTRV